MPPRSRSTGLWFVGSNPAVCSIVCFEEAGEGDGGGGGGSGGGDNSGSSNDEPPKWFIDHQKKTDERFEAMATKYGAALKELRGERGGPPKDEDKKGGDSGKPNGGDAPAGLSRKDVEQMMEFAAVREHLPDEARKGIDEIRDSQGYGQALAAANFYRAHAPATGSGEGASPPTKGHGASPADNGAPNFPKTVSEFRELQKKSPKDARAILERPDFDIEALEQR